MESGKIGGKDSWLGIVGVVVVVGVRVHSGVENEVGRVVEATVTYGGGVGVQVTGVQVVGVAAQVKIQIKVVMLTLV